MDYLSNAISINMFPIYDGIKIRITPIGLDKIPKTAVSVISHEDTAVFISQLLGREIEFNRVEIQLLPEDRLFVFQLNQRLQAGATTLPDNATFKTYLVEIE